MTTIGDGPEVNFAEDSKAPKWTAKVRYKTTASLMRGMQGMMGGMDGGGQAMPPPQQQQPRKRRRGGLLGDIIQGATGVPVPEDE